MACGAFLIHGELEPWVQHTPAGPAIAALFRNVAMPRGNVPILLPPSAARPALNKLISGAPGDVILYRLRAQEAEVALDFAAAETDWKTYAANAPDRYNAQVELADFYHRRARPQEEISALTVAAAVPEDPLQPATAQQGWHAFERMAEGMLIVNAAGRAGRLAQADRPPGGRQAILRGRGRDRSLWPDLPRRGRAGENARGCGDAPRPSGRRPRPL